MPKKEDSWYKDIPKNTNTTGNNSASFPVKKLQEGFDFLKISHASKNPSNNKDSEGN
ncbi:hypothetical protein [Niallia taxi]|uniref:hypothetical protein n=1 Tax=Niallia taxi TaxID=2499688 RepID=UPI002E1D4706|nr:hypothetical protein [Niallia taxi]